MNRSPVDNKHCQALLPTNEIRAIIAGIDINPCDAQWLV
jgi:hypothetical protein